MARLPDRDARAKVLLRGTRFRLEEGRLLASHLETLGLTPEKTWGRDCTDVVNAAVRIYGPALVRRLMPPDDPESLIHYVLRNGAEDPAVQKWALSVATLKEIRRIARLTLPNRPRGGGRTTGDGNLRVILALCKAKGAWVPQARLSAEYGLEKGGVTTIVQRLVKRGFPIHSVESAKAAGHPVEDWAHGYRLFPAT